MASSIDVWMDTEVHPGELTLAALIADLRGQSIEPLVLKRGWDNVADADLIYCRLQVEDADATTAKNTAQSYAVSAVGPILPPTFKLNDLEGIALATLVLGGATNVQEIEILAVDDPDPDDLQTFKESLGKANGGAAWTDGATNAGMYPLCMAKLSNSHTAALDLPASDMTLTYDSAQALVCANAATISVAQPASGKRSWKSYYIDAAGKMYLCEIGTDDLLVRPLTSFSDAVALGAA